MVRKATDKDKSELAVLHSQTISQGFLSKLGIRFLISLYSFLIKEELVFVYMKKFELKGFISCSICSNGIMKRFLFSCPSGIVKLILVLLKHPKFIRPLIETYHAPVLSTINTIPEIEIPETELLSISVSPLAQNDGIGTQLLHALESELKKKGILKYKVIAGKKLDRANKFYVKNGFVLVKQIKIHGDDISNVYVKNL